MLFFPGFPYKIINTRPSFQIHITAVFCQFPLYRKSISLDPAFLGYLNNLHSFSTKSSFQLFSPTDLHSQYSSHFNSKPPSIATHDKLVIQLLERLPGLLTFSFPLCRLWQIWKALHYSMGNTHSGNTGHLPIKNWNNAFLS